MNISCPNKQAGWCIFGTDPRVASEVISAVRKATDLTLIVKLSPNVTDIALMARVAEEAGADAVSLINTLTGMAIDIRTWKPKLGNITGGLSGPAIRPVAVRMVWEAAKAVAVPVIGMGGIIGYRDAVEFMLAGATAVAVGTGNFVNPGATVEIIRGLEQYLRGKHIHDVKDIIGGLGGISSGDNPDD
jgi:dihydroorotate dehydrogenase (NAD+) catalytic subunit